MDAAAGWRPAAYGPRGSPHEASSDPTNVFATNGHSIPSQIFGRAERNGTT